MIVINNIDDQKFSFNGVNYFKNFTPIRVGNKIYIANTYDSDIQLTDEPTFYSDFSVDGIIYTNVADLQNVLLPVLFTRSTLSGGGATSDPLKTDRGGYTGTSQDLADLIQENTDDLETLEGFVKKPLTILGSGQSNMVNAEFYMNDGGDKDSDARVKVWDDISSVFKVAELGEYPFPSTLNNEGKYNNSLIFHIAKRIAEKEDVEVRIIYEATGGQSIDKWTDNGVNSEYFVNIVNKINASGTTQIDGIFWLQGESDSFDLEYPTKLNSFLENLRSLPSISGTVPFVAGQLAYGYDINGVPVGSSGDNDYSAGYVLNQRFYRQFNNFIDDAYFNVADGSLLPTVAEGIGTGIHFEGTAIVDYSYKYLDTFYNTPISKPSLINNKRYTPKVITSSSEIDFDSNEIICLDASLGGMSVLLPNPLWNKKLIFKRVDDSNNTCKISTAVGSTIDLTSSQFSLIKKNHTVTVIPDSDTNYKVVDSNLNYIGSTLIESSLQSNGNLERHINLDNLTTNVLINFWLPSVTLGLSFYVKCLNKAPTKPCRIKNNASSNLDTGADIELAEGDMYYFYSDGLIYHSKKIIEKPSSIVTVNTNSVVYLGNDYSSGNLCNMSSANTNATFTLSNVVTDGRAIILINRATEPTVTGATRIKGSNFIASTNMYLKIWNNGNRTEYWFEQIAE